MNLIETHRQFLIECDNPGCSYTIPDNGEDAREYINKPCPCCGENLLTEADYLQDEKLMKMIKGINKCFGWLGYFFGKKRDTIEVHVKDGVKIREI